MDLDVVMLSRAQFALTIMFHYLFPPLSIGLGALMVLMEGTYLVTKNEVWERMTRFWTRIFAVNFAVGVATGIVMEFQFGTNWAVYSRFVGDVFGSALAAEGIFAFFLESGFLAVLVFGWDRVGPRTHFFATLMVFLGSVFSATWIVIANSWQQTPAGHRIVGEGAHARAEIVDFWAMVFNPSSMHRLGHVILGCFVLGAFFVASVSAWHLLRGRHQDVAQRSLTLALGFALASSIAIGVSGHSQAVMVAQHQPAKLAALEGHFHTGPAPLYAFGIPDVEEERVRFGIGIPGGLSFMIHGSPSAPVVGLDQFPEEDRPPVVVPFAAYHLMVSLGGWFVALSAGALFLRWRGKLFDNRKLLWAIVLTVPGPYLANQAGWVAAEVGRQPWVVYGLLRTKDAVSRNVPGEHILGSIIVFTLLYLALFGLWLVVMNGKIQHGPAAAPATAGGPAGVPPEREEAPPSSLLDVASRRADSGSKLTMTERSSDDTGAPATEDAVDDASGVAAGTGDGTDRDGKG